ncbi:MAG: hypothetical protein ABW007_09930, partial [Chitinophagaceae bacterium]
MSDFLITDVSTAQINDAQVKKFVDHVVDYLKPQIYEALYNRSENKPANYEPLSAGVKQAKNYKSLAAVVHERLAAKSVDQVKAMLLDRGPRLELARATRVNFEPEAYKDAVAKFKRTDFKTDFRYVNDSLFTRRFAGILELQDDAAPGEQAASVAPASIVSAARTLKLMLKTVKCVDETDPEWWGKDS